MVQPSGFFSFSDEVFGKSLSYYDLLSATIRMYILNADSCHKYLYKPVFNNKEENDLWTYLCSQWNTCRWDDV